MKNFELNSTQEKILESLVDLYRWETMNIPMMRSLIGRHVYYCVVSELLKNSEYSIDRSIKQVFSHPAYTERAIRLKIRELENMDLLINTCSNNDKRVRRLLASEELTKMIFEHMNTYQKILEKKFLLVQK